MEVLEVITGIQIVAILFSIFMVYVTFLHLKKGELSSGEAVFFFLIWIGAIFLTIIPQSADFILKTFNIYRLLDLATIIGFMLLTGLGFKIFIEIKDLKRKLERLVREKSLKGLK